MPNSVINVIFVIFLLFQLRSIRINLSNIEMIDKAYVFLIVDRLGMALQTLIIFYLPFLIFLFFLLNVFSYTIRFLILLDIGFISYEQLYIVMDLFVIFCFTSFLQKIFYQKQRLRKWQLAWRYASVTSTLIPRIISLKTKKISKK